MYAILIAFVISISTLQPFMLRAHEKKDPSLYLQGRLSPTDKRYSTFLLALQLLDQRKAKVIVETGTARQGDTANSFMWDGGATIIFSEWAENHHSMFYSVDIDPQAILISKRALNPRNLNVQLVCHDSIAFLKNFNHPIDFLYLDSYDFDHFDPKPSQEHHLKEIIAAYPHLTAKSIVMFDDCDLPHGGKGALAIPYLVNKGWKILANGYQVILAREE